MTVVLGLEDDPRIIAASGKADLLIEAVAVGDGVAVASVFAGLDTSGLQALAIVLAAGEGPPATPQARLERAVVLAARRFQCVPEAVLSRSKHREPTDARAVVCYVGRLFGINASVIGRHLGRDHTTVLAACDRVGTTPRLRGAAHDIAASLGWERDLEVAG